MLDSDPDPHAVSETPPAHELTDMERFFDNLFNQHMVSPQPPADPRAGDEDEAHDRAHDDRGATAV